MEISTTGLENGMTQAGHTWLSIGIEGGESDKDDELGLAILEHQRRVIRMSLERITVCKMGGLQER